MKTDSLMYPIVQTMIMNTYHTTQTIATISGAEGILLEQVHSMSQVRARNARLLVKRGWLFFFGLLSTNEYYIFGAGMKTHFSVIQKPSLRWHTGRWKLTMLDIENY